MLPPNESRRSEVCSSHLRRQESELEHVGDRQIAVLDLKSASGLQADSLSHSMLETEGVDPAYMCRTIDQRVRDPSKASSLQLSYWGWLA